MREKIIHILLGVVISLLLIAYLTLCFLTDIGHMMPRTMINGVDLSGMTQNEAVNALNADTKRRCDEAILTILAEDETYTVDIGSIMECDCEALVKRAFARNQCGFLSRGFLLLSALCIGYEEESPPDVPDMESLYAMLEAEGVLDDDSTIQTSYREERGRLIFTMGIAGYVVDKGKLATEIIAAVQAKDYETVIVCPKIPDTVDPIDLEKVYEEIFKEPLDASLDAENNYQIVESVTGVSFDKESAQNALDMAQEGSTVIVDLIYTEPEITTEDMQEHLFADELAAYTTKVTGSSNRITNIKLAIEKCNHAVLLRNEVFSFNDIVGDQNEETGFKMAGAVENGKPVQAYGGGICQVSSTIFVAVLYANLEIVERWNHDLVSGYVPAGLDAAVAWGELDFRFANNTPYPIKLEISYVNGYLTVTVLGTRMNEEQVEIETEVLSSTATSLEVLTYRNVLPSGEEESLREQISYSKYVR